MGAHETACYIGVSDSKFAEMRKTGKFPVKPLPYGKNWDQRAVDRWLNDLSGLIEDNVEVRNNQDTDKSWIEAARNWHR
jgi:hypothetical protein